MVTVQLPSPTHSNNKKLHCLTSAHVFLDRLRYGKKLPLLNNFYSFDGRGCKAIKVIDIAWASGQRQDTDSVDILNWTAWSAVQPCLGTRQSTIAIALIVWKTNRPFPPSPIPPSWIRRSVVEDGAKHSSPMSFIVFRFFPLIQWKRTQHDFGFEGFCTLQTRPSRTRPVITVDVLNRDRLRHGNDDGNVIHTFHCAFSNTRPENYAHLWCQYLRVCWSTLLEKVRLVYAKAKRYSPSVIPSRDNTTPM